MRPRRRLLLAAAAAPLLAACGFQLRQAPDFGFSRIAIAMPATSSLAVELRRQLQAAGNIQITDAAHAQVVFDSAAGEQRQRIVVGLTATGEVREFQLRIHLKFRLRTPDGRELLPETEIVRQIDQSYSETAALSKESESAMLYHNLQNDIVQQIIRRLATVRP
jgi:LPS-assembly lipoprotein